MRAASVPIRMPAKPLRSKRLLAFADDARLVEYIRRGSEPAFEVAFERYGRSILGFCRHMLGSTEEAEDAVQHTFAAAYRDLMRSDGREITLKPWLYTIARNRCLSMLRARREQPLELDRELATTGLSDDVQKRADLRELLADLRELPEDQRAALLLSELGDLTHTEVAGVLGCEVPKVKALVFRARSGLIARREARDTPCEEIREQLANLRGGSLRRSELRHHLAGCPGCRDYRQEVKRQRQLLAVALPVVPGLGLKKSVLAAAGIGGGAAGGGGAAAGIGGLAASFGSLGSATAAKVAVVGALAAGGAVAGTAVVQDTGRDGASDPAPGAAAGGAAEKARSEAKARLEAKEGTSHGEQVSAERRAAQRGEERSTTRSNGHAKAVAKADRAERGRRFGQAKRSIVTPKGPNERARGPIDSPRAQTPVRRGPVQPRLEAVPRVKRTPPPQAAPAPLVVEPLPETETAPALELPAEEKLLPKK